ncbi:MAG: hypothetical protein D6778_03090 [Nitrospirae bacterium]|nr:MAG: hypothetical protein D6778_03090 [Nitrospirota bacterium]
MPLVILIISLIFLPGCQKEAQYDLHRGTYLTFNEMIDKLTTADIIIIGELHNNQRHHENQLRIIKAIHQRHPSIAIGLEMFPAESQKILDDWLGGRISDNEFIKHYYRVWAMPWPLYRDIFFFAKENQIPLLGLNVPERIAREIAKKGFQALSTDVKRSLPVSSCPVDEQYMDFIRRALKMHKKGVDFQYFCEAQKIRDIVMAHNAVNYLRSHPGEKMLILAGGGHAWRPGLPREIEKVSDYRVLVLLNCNGQDCSDVTASEADFLMW